MALYACNSVRHAHGNRNGLRMDIGKVHDPGGNTGRADTAIGYDRRNQRGGWGTFGVPDYRMASVSHVHPVDPPNCNASNGFQRLLLTNTMLTNSRLHAGAFEALMSYSWSTFCGLL